MATPEDSKFTNISHQSFSPSIYRYNVLCVPTQTVSRIYLIKSSLSQVNILIIFIALYPENFNADVAIMVKMCDMVTGNPGGRGLASFVATMNLCQVWLKLAKLVVLEKIFPLISSFLLFRNYLPFANRVVCAKFGWNWPSGFGEDFYMLSMYFLFIIIFSPWKRALHTSFKFPSLKGCFVPSLAEDGPVVLKRKTF